jgi:hypothetical protein
MKDNIALSNINNHKQKLLISVLILLSIFAKTQVLEDFSDGNINENPLWTGDTSVFVLTSSSAIPPEMKPALKLNDDKSDTAFIATANELSEAVEWQFWCKLSFNSSSNNNMRAYLMSESENLKQELSGYLLLIGGANDSIYFAKQENTEIIPLLKFSSAFTGNTTNTFRFKITKDDNSVWNFYFDPEGGYNWQWQGSILEENLYQNHYFGFFCKYTSSNATKFYFDDIHIQIFEEDTIPPHLTNIDLLNSSELLLYFDEALNEDSTSNFDNYECDNGIGHPIQTIYNSGNNTVSLLFSTNFEENITYTLSVQNITDLYGNVMNETNLSFQWEEIHTPAIGDIIISEIMADQNPTPNNLPAKDFLELYNRTPNNIQLQNCKIQLKNTGSFIEFPEYILPPNTFLIITKNSDTGLFQDYGHVLGLPGFSLNNESTLKLFNSSNQLLDIKSYETAWYHDPEKENGGWSIEIIDRNKACYNGDNWLASNNLDGGTPGQVNSVDGEYFSPPAISKAELSSPHSISVRFKHRMDSIQSSKPSSYSLNSSSMPNNAVLQEDYTTVELFFDDELTSGNSYILSITDTIYDCAGEYIPIGTNIEIVIPEEATPYDILFSEIMADPIPATGLPEYEYLELFNRSNKIISLNNWKLTIGETTKNLSGLLLLPKEYVILCNEEASIFFQWFGKTYALSSLSLPNSSQILQLKNQEGALIDQVTYSSNWHETSKKEGGWSLELINPDYPCMNNTNWHSSIAEEGGTPGNQNSVYSEEEIQGHILQIVTLTPSILEIWFNQNFQEADLEDIFNYSINPSVGTPVNVEKTGLFSVIISLADSLKHQILYNLRMDCELTDCSGKTNLIQETYYFGLLEEPEYQDIMINEVLFNPWSEGVDFVEVVNHSPKFIDMSKMQLGYIRKHDFSPDDTLFFPVSDQPFFIFPEKYKVLTKDPKSIINQYDVADSSAFVIMNSFPSYNNDQGTVILRNSQDEIIDLFSYNENMHFPLLNSTEGVSLERISLDHPTNDTGNWHSAAETRGFATPTSVNSQYTPPSDTENPISIKPQIFSPDNDGYQDVASIIYHFDKEGYMGNILIYDTEGRLIKLLQKNTLLGTNGQFFWNGEMENKEIAPEGIYIVLFQIYDLKKSVKKFKIPITVAKHY